jgi:hypothetical protein
MSVADQADEGTDLLAEAERLIGRVGVIRQSRTEYSVDRCHRERRTYL